MLGKFCSPSLVFSPVRESILYNHIYNIHVEILLANQIINPQKYWYNHTFLTYMFHLPQVQIVHIQVRISPCIR